MGTAGPKGSTGSFGHNLLPVGGAVAAPGRHHGARVPDATVDCHAGTRPAGGVALQVAPSSGPPRPAPHVMVTQQSVALQYCSALRQLLTKHIIMEVATIHLMY